MFLRPLIGGVLALPILMASAASALPPIPAKAPIDSAGEPIIRVQAADPRVTALEEQIRQLTGRVEELNFQILQMQDQLRRMQEDNEFRFQELENKRSDAGSGDTPRRAETQTRESRQLAANPNSEPTTQQGELPKSLGSIRFDADGNVIGGDVTEPVDLLGSNPNAPALGNETVAALPSADSPDELYRNSYEFILSGDYRTAEAGFRQYIERFPGESNAADAHFWLGESLLGQERYQEAAETFLRASKEYPSAPKRPDMLLKLGVSLAAMNQNDVACATFSEITARYPDVSGALKERVIMERQRLGC